MSQVAYCSNPSLTQKLQRNQVKMKNTRDKIHTLKIKEQQEKSKLVRNQRRLETTASNLEASKQKYSTMDAQLQDMEHI